MRWFEFCGASDPKTLWLQAYVFKVPTVYKRRKTFRGLKDRRDWWTNSAFFSEVRWCVGTSGGPWGRWMTCCHVASVLLILYKVLVCALEWNKWTCFIFKWLHRFLFRAKLQFFLQLVSSVSASTVWFFFKPGILWLLCVGPCCPVPCGFCAAWFLTWHHVSRKRKRLLILSLSSQSCVPCWTET